MKNRFYFFFAVFFISTFSHAATYLLGGDKSAPVSAEESKGKQFDLLGYDQSHFVYDGKLLTQWVERFDNQCKGIVEPRSKYHGTIEEPLEIDYEKADECYGNFGIFPAKKESETGDVIGMEMIPVAADDGGKIYFYRYETASDEEASAGEPGKFTTLLKIDYSAQVKRSWYSGPSEKATFVATFIESEYIYVTHNGWLIAFHVKFNNSGDLEEIEGDRRFIDLGKKYRQATGLAANYGLTEQGSSVAPYLDMVFGKPRDDSDTEPRFRQVQLNTDGAIVGEPGVPRAQIHAHIEHLKNVNISYSNLQKKKGIDGKVSGITANWLRALHLEVEEGINPYEAIVTRGLSLDVNVVTKYGNMASFPMGKPVTVPSDKQWKVVYLDGSEHDLQMLEVKDGDKEVIVPSMILVHGQLIYSYTIDKKFDPSHSRYSGRDEVVLGPDGNLRWYENRKKFAEELAEDQGIDQEFKFEPKTFQALYSISRQCRGYFKEGNLYKGGNSYELRSPGGYEPDPEYEGLGTNQMYKDFSSPCMQTEMAEAPWGHDPIVDPSKRLESQRTVFMPRLQIAG